MKKIKSRNNKLGIMSLLISLLILTYMICYFFTGGKTSNYSIAIPPYFYAAVIFLIFNIVGMILGVVSIFQKVDRKTISLLGLFLNLISIPFIIFCMAISAKTVV